MIRRRSVLSEFVVTAQMLLIWFLSIQYAGRARNYENVWNPHTTVPGHEDIVGMMQVKVN